ncbi:phenylalanine--tRNA ligase subunit beta [Hugenholtzia roseola]|uniref:phenylalanine--tRNA ligase subunit beta n=1 Tax=Hugenholtzia roseola TaxID=1002 RepID=UPI0003F9171B|nr:phenylalanine--tRNA ligase subunit beta [Hugenholtzia roseola]
MNISLKWLQKYIALSDKTPQELEAYLTELGLEVEAIETYETVKGGLEGLVVGQVLTCEKHPDADKLKLTTVDIGAENPLSIVCGAPNVAAGQKVIVATVGATLYPTEGEPLKIKKGKIRGAVSEGMICAEDEIGLGHSHEGIMVLQTDAPNGSPAATVLEVESDTVFTIGLTPNRIDAASHYGVARDLKARLKRELCRPSVESFKPKNTDFKIEIEVKNSEAAPRYAGLTLTEVKVAPSPDWLKQALQAIGVRPINNVVDITNYVLHAFGQPLHAFDADKIAGNKIIVTTLPKDTTFKTLDEVERKLSDTDLMICDGNQKPLCLGGIFGGFDSGVTESTTRIFLESAYFNPTYIRRSAKHHDLFTDASFRFSRGADINNVLYPLKYAALLIEEIASGKISSEITDFYPQKIENAVFSVRYDYLDKIIGNSLEKELIFDILESLEIEVIEKTDTDFKVSVPPYRVDVLQPADIAEEVLRVYGLNNIAFSQTPRTDFVAAFAKPDAHLLRQQVSQLLVGAGLSEMMNNSLTSSKYSKALQIDSKDVVILNYLSEDLDVMRQDLLFGGLESIKRNQNRGVQDIAAFEFGKFYQKHTAPEGKNKYVEAERLAIWLSGNKGVESWREKAKKADFYDLGELASKILNLLNIKGLEQRTLTDDLYFQYGLELGKRKGKDDFEPIVRLGLVKRKVCKLADLNVDVFYADLNWEWLIKNHNEKKTYQEISRFPSVRRDLSLVVAKNISFQTLENIAKRTERKLLQEVGVFDVYEGERIDADKKAYALRFILQDQDKTLDEQTIEKTMNKLMLAFEKEADALIRK